MHSTYLLDRSTGIDQNLPDEIFDHKLIIRNLPARKFIYLNIVTRINRIALIIVAYKSIFSTKYEKYYLLFSETFPTDMNDAGFSGYIKFALRLKESFMKNRFACRM